MAFSQAARDFVKAQEELDRLLADKAKQQAIKDQATSVIVEDLNPKIDAARAVLAAAKAALKAEL